MTRRSRNILASAFLIIGVGALATGCGYEQVRQPDGSTAKCIEQRNFWTNEVESLKCRHEDGSVTYMKP